MLVSGGQGRGRRDAVERLLSLPRLEAASLLPANPVIRAEETNAIATEFARTGLLPGTEVTKIRELLARYLDNRILFYTVNERHQLAQIDVDTARTQDDPWPVV
jgi:hypothetical protein